jgi:hypothetical protein
MNHSALHAISLFSNKCLRQTHTPVQMQTKLQANLLHLLCNQVHEEFAVLHFQQALSLLQTYAGAPFPKTTNKTGLYEP